jgi:hypothetical protein
VNDQKITTENISGKKDSAFLDVQYDIPVELTEDKDQYYGQINPSRWIPGGPFFYVRTIKR